MSAYITEAWLRERFTLTDGTEIRLPTGGRLTPAAQSLIEEHNLQIKYVDEAGRVFVDEAASPESPELKRVHPLTSSDERLAACCTLCQQEIGKKPDAMTHLNATTLVAKNDLRIRFRGQVDATIAQAVLIQARMQRDKQPAQAQQWLADIRSGLGAVMQAEVTGDELALFRMGDLDATAIHAISHNPLKYIGHEHIVPAVEHGLLAAELNVLRAQIRLCETAAAAVYISNDFTILRPDIMQGLNRLSSAVYVLMIMVYVAQRNPNAAAGLKWS